MPLTITNADVQALLSVAAQGNTLHTSSLLTILARINRPYDEADIMLLFKDQGGNNLVHIAANNGYPNIITFVCAHSVFNAKPGMRQSILNARNGTSETPIYVAAKGNHTSCVEVLAQNGVAVDAEGPFGFRIAHVVAEIGNFTMLNWVLQKGADGSAVSLSGDTPGHIAARKGYLNCLRVLLAHGADLCGENSAGMTPDNIAESKNDEEMVAWMFENNLF